MVVPPSSIPKNHTDPNRRKAKAVFVVLARNSDLWALTDSMKQMEDRFNHWAGYDWVFLNDEPFDDVFKKSVPDALSRRFLLETLPENRVDLSLVWSPSPNPSGSLNP
jgi:hypothetical protein